MRDHLKRHRLAIAGSLFLLNLAFVAYAHMRYTRAEHIYLNHLATVTFRPHINILTGLSAYEAKASRWLALQTIGTAVLLAISITMIVLIWRQRTARMQEDALTAEVSAD